MDRLDELVAECLRGDPDRFEDIVKLCEPAVRAVTAAMSPDPDAVPDLVQETFVIAYRKLPTYRSGTHFKAWIKAIARNVCQNERRRWYRRRAMQERYRTELERQANDDIERFVEGLPEDVLESLRDCVNHLGDRTRSMVDEYYYKACSIGRLAELFRLSSTAAKVTLHRARKAVGQCLQKKGKA